MSRIALTPVLSEQRGFRYWLFENEPMCRTILQQKEWEPHVRMFLEAFLKPGDYFIDVGAAFGVHTLSASRIVGETGRVFAFEPQPPFFGLLQKNCAENGVHNAELFHAAVTNRAGVAGLSPIRIEPDGLAMADVFLVKQGQSSLQVDCLALDDGNFGRPIKLIKIDVQGAERAVLEGAAQLIKCDRPHLIVEFEEYCLRRFNYSCPALFNHIRSLDYHIFFLNYFYPSDHICVPNERLTEFRRAFGAAIKPHAEPNDLNQNLQCGVVEKLCL